MNDLNTLMHAAVDDARPDLSALLDGAVRDGRRLRRRRSIGYAGACLAVATIATCGAVALGGHDDRSTSELPAAAGSGTTSASATTSEQEPALKAGDVLRLGHGGLTGAVVPCPATGAECEPAHGHWLGASSLQGAGSGLAIVLSGPAAAVEQFWSDGFGNLTSRYPGITIAAADSVWPSINPDPYAGQDVRIHLAGWTQVGSVADGKQSLEGPDGAVADIVWRAASGYADWLSGEKNDPRTWTSTVHDGVFVTIQGGRGTTPSAIDALGASLTWK